MTQQQFIQDFAREIEKAYQIQEELKALIDKTNSTLESIRENNNITSSIISENNGK